MTINPVQILAIGFGGAIGGIARFWLTEVVARRIGETFPWGTLFVNVSGALAIGLLAALLSGPGAHVEFHALSWPALVVGIVGSYTTVSAFSLQTLELLRTDKKRLAYLNITASLGLCLAAVVAGSQLGHWLFAS